MGHIPMAFTRKTPLKHGMFSILTLTFADFDIVNSHSNAVYACHEKRISANLNFSCQSFLANVFAICRRPSVYLSVVCRLSVTFVHPTQPIEILGNVSAPCNTLVT